MGVAKPVILSGISFSKQGDADSFFKLMLSRYDDGEYLDELDEDMVYDLLQRHPEADIKVGAGVVGFFRARSSDHPSSCFHVHRIDGSKTDFSYKSCVRGKPKSLKARFYEACQSSIANSLAAKKKALFEAADGEICCYKTGEPTTFVTSDYRHTKPRFREIVDGFIKVDGITISDDLLFHGADMQYSTVFVNFDMAGRFVNYHASVANLEIFKRFEIPDFT